MSVSAESTILRPFFGLDKDMLVKALAEAGEPAFRATQLMQWVYQRGVTDPAQMTDISKVLRGKLESWLPIEVPKVEREQRSEDGTIKWVLQIAGGQAVETVYIPEADRGTLCISSQAGCALDCSFCSTAQQGFSRNLSASEIIGQVWFAHHALNAFGVVPRPISNVVFMGMGEPLANYSAVVPAIRVLLDDFAFGLSKRRVTVSTAGMVPFMDRLRDSVDVALAVSLHAADDALRNELVPINRKYPLADLMGACDRYVRDTDRRTHILYEYVMLDGVNDQPHHAKALARLLRGRSAKVNLIPFNPFPGTRYQRSSDAAIAEFHHILINSGVRATTRRTRGDDIDAACGQLVGQVKSRQSRRLGDRPLPSVTEQPLRQMTVSQ